MTTAMFQVIDPSNSATIRMSDYSARQNQAQSETWIVGRDVKAIWWAIKCYANKNHIHAEDVGYSVVYDDREIITDSPR